MIVGLVYILVGELVGGEIAIIEVLQNKVFRVN